jgi:hypothetical protein
MTAVKARRRRALSMQKRPWINTPYDTADRMTDNEQRPGYRGPKQRGPDRLLMFLVLAFVGMVLLRTFWFFN